MNNKTFDIEKAFLPVKIKERALFYINDLIEQADYIICSTSTSGSRYSDEEFYRSYAYETVSLDKLEYRLTKLFYKHFILSFKNDEDKTFIHLNVKYDSFSIDRVVYSLPSPPSKRISYDKGNTGISYGKGNTMLINGKIIIAKYFISKVKFKDIQSSHLKRFIINNFDLSFNARVNYDE